MIRVSRYRRKSFWAKSNPTCAGCKRESVIHITADSISGEAQRKRLDLCQRCSDTIYRNLDKLRT